MKYTYYKSINRCNHIRIYRQGKNILEYYAGNNWCKSGYNTIYNLERAVRSLTKISYEDVLLELI